MARRTHFGVVDQAIKSMEQVKEYITVGMETTIDVAYDLVEHDRENTHGIKKLQSILVNYIKMEQELGRFQEAVNTVKVQASSSRESMDLEALLEQILQSLPKENKEAIKQHEKYLLMNERIIQHPGESVPELNLGPSSVPDDEDIAMTQQEINIRCPITGKDMKNPVRNTHCGHNYDKEGIMHCIKNKGKRVKCPVGGCGNDKPVDIHCLEENKDLRKYIERKTRHLGKRPK